MALQGAMPVQTCSKAMLNVSLPRFLLWGGTAHPRGPVVRAGNAIVSSALCRWDLCVACPPPGWFCGAFQGMPEELSPKGPPLLPLNSSRLCFAALRNEQRQTQLFAVAKTNAFLCSDAPTLCWLGGWAVSKSHLDRICFVHRPAL